MKSLDDKKYQVLSIVFDIDGREVPISSPIPYYIGMDEDQDKIVVKSVHISEPYDLPPGVNFGEMDGPSKDKQETSD